MASLDSVELATDAPTNATGNSSCSEDNVKHAENEQKGKSDETVDQKGQLVQDEEREKGSVSFSVYWKYITMAYKGALVPLILLAQILFQVLQIGSNYWMAWAAPTSADVEPPVSSSMLIYVYVALAIGSSFCILVRAVLLVTAGYKTATLMFNKMHKCIFRAPMSFFDSTPTGRILNRVREVLQIFFFRRPCVGLFCISVKQSFCCRHQLIKLMWTLAFLSKLVRSPFPSYSCLESLQLCHRSDGRSFLFLFL